jgi:serine/threonine protein kinase
LKEIDHPNLIKFDGLYETESLVYLVTEYLSGGTLEDTLKNKAILTGELIQSVIRDILSGLAYLDENQIMHRDIKP